MKEAIKLILIRSPKIEHLNVDFMADTKKKCCFLQCQNKSLCHHRTEENSSLFRFMVLTGKLDPVRLRNLPGSQNRCTGSTLNRIRFSFFFQSIFWRRRSSQTRLWCQSNHPSISSSTAVALFVTCWTTGESQAFKIGSYESRKLLILLDNSCWVCCDGLASHPGGFSKLQVTSCWVSYDGVTSYPGGRVGVNTPSYFMLWVPSLLWTDILIVILSITSLTIIRCYFS